MKDFAYFFYHGTKWQECRRGFIAQRIAEDGGMCQRCHERPGYIIHHRIELTAENIRAPEVSLNWKNLEYVCFECHNRLHNNFVDSRRVDFDAEGNVIERRSPR